MMFTKAKPAELAEFSTLPAGFDDENSAYYVHPDLRDHYDAARPHDAGAVFAAADDLIRKAANAAVAERYPIRELQPRDGYDKVTDEAAKIRAAQLDDYLRLAQHHLRMKDAIVSKRTADQRAANASALRATHTCPLCGEYDLNANGPVQVRALDGGKAIPTRSMPTLQSCYSCFAEWAWQLREARAAAVLEDGQTRRQLVATLIS